MTVNDRSGSGHVELFEGLYRCILLYIHLSSQDNVLEDAWRNGVDRVLRRDNEGAEPVTIMDYGCADGHFSLSARRVSIANGRFLPSSSETEVSAGVRTKKLYNAPMRESLHFVFGPETG